MSTTRKKPVRVPNIPQMQARKMRDCLHLVLRGLESGHVTSKPIVMNNGMGPVVSLESQVRKALGLVTVPVHPESTRAKR